MAEKNIFPTKGNLIMVKNSLELAKQGYELMDKKRNILIRELMNLNEEAKAIQSEINETFTNAMKPFSRRISKWESITCRKYPTRCR